MTKQEISNYIELLKLKCSPENKTVIDLLLKLEIECSKDIFLETKENEYYTGKWDHGHGETKIAYTLSVFELLKQILSLACQ